MKTKGNPIGWCDITVNPVTGCPNGCEYCYARSMNNRYKWIEDFSKPQFFPHRLKDFRTKEPMIIFIDSMSDIGCWKDEWKAETYKAMAENQQNIYLALTKKYDDLHWLQIDARLNRGRGTQLFIGATVTNNEQAKAVINSGGADFISFEPLLETIETNYLLYLNCRWWIVGDMTKQGKPQRVIKPWQVFEMADRAEELNIPFFMKESINGLCGGFMKKEFPEGWKTHKHAETEVHNYAE